MRDLRGKRYWLVGASEGLGVALARKMAEAGAQLVLSARQQDRLQELADSLPGGAVVVALDVSDPASVTDAARLVGDVDGVIYLAAAYWPMKAQVIDAEQAAVMVDVNLTGAMRVLAQVIPGMIARGAGHIVLTGSLAAFRGLPGAVGYAASKAGLQSLAETLRLDLKGYGVDVQIGHPGFIRTRLTDKNDFAMPALMEPDQAATHMMRLIRGRRFQYSFPWGFSRIFRIARLLPDWIFFRLFA